jgi:hypothetical protein
MGVSNGDEDGGGVNGDGSRSNSLSRQLAETETSVPQNSSSMVAALRNFSWMDADSFRLFASEGMYRLAETETSVPQNTLNMGIKHI